MRRVFLVLLIIFGSALALPDLTVTRIGISNYVVSGANVFNVTVTNNGDAAAADFVVNVSINETISSGSYDIILFSNDYDDPTYFWYSNMTNLIDELDVECNLTYYDTNAYSNLSSYNLSEFDLAIFEESGANSFTQEEIGSVVNSTNSLFAVWTFESPNMGGLVTGYTYYDDGSYYSPLTHIYKVQEHYITQNLVAGENEFEDTVTNAEWWGIPYYADLFTSSGFTVLVNSSNATDANVEYLSVREQGGFRTVLIGAGIAADNLDQGTNVWDLYKRSVLWALDVQQSNTLNFTTISLAAGASANVSAVITMSYFSSAEITAAVDYTEVISESNEGNNALSANVSLNIAPVIVIGYPGSINSTALVPNISVSDANAGQTLSIMIEIMNSTPILLTLNDNLATKDYVTSTAYYDYNYWSSGGGGSFSADDYQPESGRLLLAGGGTSYYYYWYANSGLYFATSGACGDELINWKTSYNLGAVFTPNNRLGSIGEDHLQCFRIWNESHNTLRMTYNRNGPDAVVFSHNYSSVPALINISSFSPGLFFLNVSVYDGIETSRSVYLLKKPAEAVTVDFSGGLTTDFSTIDSESLDSADFTLDEGTFGLVNFFSADVSGFTTIPLSSAVNISNRTVIVDTGIIPGLNTSASILMQDTGLTGDFLIYRANGRHKTVCYFNGDDAPGDPCGLSGSVTVADTNISFSVSSFSGYYSGEDNDLDGMDDGWEGTNGLDNMTYDADLDPDSDQLNNSDEFAWDTDPQDEDTDGDGFLDGVEVYTYGTDPLNPYEFYIEPHTITASEFDYLAIAVLFVIAAGLAIKIIKSKKKH